MGGTIWPRPPDRSELEELVRGPAGPRVSIYLPLGPLLAEPGPGRGHPLLDQAVRKTVGGLVAAGLHAAGVRAWSRLLREVELDWAAGGPWRALALFLDARGLRAWPLPGAVLYRVAVGAEFALRPLLRSRAAGPSALRSWRRSARDGRVALGIEPAARALAAGRVRRLWLDADADVPGRIDRTEGRLERDGRSAADALDALAAWALAEGVPICVLDAECLPAAGPAAAELR